MAKYNLTKKADHDISEMYSYTVTAFGETQADKYYNGLISQIEFVASSPETYRKLERFSPAVRICPYQSHIIIYRVQDNDVVEIIRVHPARTNWRAFYE